MKLQHFREVVAVAEHGSIRAAARAMDVTQPGLTRSLAELERQLGGNLFERKPRGVVATPLGHAFLRRASSILNEVRRTREEMSQLCGLATGTVTAGLSMATHFALLPPALVPFRRRYPDVQLHIIEGFYPTLEQGLRSGSVDFYVGVDPGKKVAPDLSRELISPNRRAVLCRTGHPLASAGSLADLCGTEWATTSITAEAAAEVRAVFEKHGLPVPKTVLRTQSALTLMTCLLHSDLMAMVPVQWNEAALTRGLLQIVPVREELAAQPIISVTRTDLPLTPAATHLLDLLKRSKMMAAAVGKAPSSLGRTSPALQAPQAARERSAKGRLPNP